MAKKWGQISLSRLLRETDEAKQQRNRVRNRVVLVFVVIAAIIISISVLGYLTPLFVPAYEFKTGVNHPLEINNLLKNGTVVLFLSSNDEDWCKPCKAMATNISNLQSQYTDVKFLRFNFDDNVTSSQLFKNYGIDTVPTVIVIRGDGAVATFIGLQDTGPIKNAINDAQNWQQTHPTQSP